MKQGTESKAKFKRLQRKLSLALYVSKGLLQSLWDFAIINCPAGDIGRFSDQEIADCIEWDGDASELIEALVETKWLDRHDTSRLIIHDWPEHCEDSVHMALARKRLLFANGTIPKLTRFTQAERQQALSDYERLSATTKTPESTQQTPESTLPSQAIPLPSHTNTNPIQADPCGDAQERPPTGPTTRAEMIPIPDSLETPEFLSGWDRWIEHLRVRLNGRLSQLSLQANMLAFARAGPSKAVAMIDHSIKNHWTYLEENDAKRTGGKPAQAIPIGAGQRYDPNASDAGRW